MSKNGKRALEREHDGLGNNANRGKSEATQGKLHSKVLICGGKVFKDEEFLCNYLDFKRMSFTDDCTIIDGGATGADSLGYAWREDRGLRSERYFPDWNNLDAPNARIKQRRDGTYYNANAGFDRNQEMIDSGKPELVIAFPGNNGTRDMIRRAIAANIPVFEIRYKKKGPKWPFYIKLINY